MYFKTWSLYTKLTFNVLILLFAYIIGKNLFNQLWNDEIYSLSNFVFVPFKTIVTDYHSTNNHIFYNFINSVFIKILGIESINTLIQYPVIIRILPLIYSFLTCVFVYLSAKLLFNESVAFLALAMLVSTIAFTNQAVQARGYSLSLMLAGIMFYITVSEIQKSSLKNIILLILIVALFLYTILSNLWLVMAAISILTLLKHWRIAIAYSLGLLFAILLYFPVLESFSGNETLMSLQAYPWQIFTVYMPKLFYYFIGHRYLLLVFLSVAIYMLYPKYKITVFCVSFFFILPFVFSFIWKKIPPDRIFLVFIPVLSVFIGYTIHYVLSLAKKIDSIILPAVFLYLIVSNIFVIYEVNTRLETNIDKGIRQQNLMYNYYLHQYNPNEVAAYCKDKKEVFLFDVEPHDMIYYLDFYKIKPQSMANLDSVISANKTVWFITRFPVQALDSLKKSLPYASMQQENLAHGYYSVIKCQLD